MDKYHIPNKMVNQPSGRRRPRWASQHHTREVHTRHEGGRAAPLNKGTPMNRVMSSNAHAQNDEKRLYGPCEGINTPERAQTPLPGRDRGSEARSEGEIFCLRRDQ